MVPSPASGKTVVVAVPSSSWLNFNLGPSLPPISTSNPLPKGRNVATAFSAAVWLASNEEFKLVASRATALTVASLPSLLNSVKGVTVRLCSTSRFPLSLSEVSTSCCTVSLLTRPVAFAKSSLNLNSCSLSLPLWKPADTEVSKLAPVGGTVSVTGVPATLTRRPGKGGTEGRVGGRLRLGGRVLGSG